MDTRQQILGAAERVVKQRGLARVTARDIAREAGYADGTLYTHFVHKEDIFLAVLRENLPSIQTPLSAERVGVRTVAENLEELALALLSFFEKVIPLSASLFADSELLRRHRQALKEDSKGPQRSYEYVASYIQEEQQLGRINEDVVPLSVAALLLGSCFQYVFIQQFLGEDPLPVSTQQFVKDLVHTLLVGIVPQKG